MGSTEDLFRTVIQKIFNNWTGLQLAVEHGMGGRNGHKTAIEVMNYMYEFCIGNEGVTESDILDTLEEIMDQEFSTIFEDGSLTEISTCLLRYLKLCKEGKADEIQNELSRFPQKKEWLTSNVNTTYTCDSSDDESSSDSQMDIDTQDVDTNHETENVNTESEEGWSVVKGRRRK